ncbi:4'-phosphopantetheinyl transferase superfamily protein [Geothrix sp. PMB-07]|uniref:4'-phosphopantetheinyl transferase family protein n=1 Tax=Geothrix sp. PMB-07 TaxID=3068640 RepID=UPI002740F2E5|nr:4'-phosphopantetheinyl transferase superfamily protein [Geothrix sp. PMB-07]WLT31301.1 4'-phosphopantetheinyl transferase superfamily protein [Geothrix sp. PMB-07]
MMPVPLDASSADASRSHPLEYAVHVSDASDISINGLIELEPDACGRPRALGAEGQPVSISTSRTTGARVVAWAERGRIGVDLECLAPSDALEAASACFLPQERAWADTLPLQERWHGHLLLWTAKEALLKALGQGFAFGLDQIELEPLGGHALRLRSLCGSAQLAQGWRINHQVRDLAGQRYLIAIALG